ncbi:hypothetical protein EAG_15722 [Camponotus floridanus]|uniref:Uncharacterized protein n=1 Tax=Camponotus floridanus TaxID=104421 RepID=E2AXB3_CAMFO|nr:hypothetical protein EAG_15722 [Camponotus floridanus]
MDPFPEVERKLCLIVWVEDNMRTDAASVHRLVLRGRNFGCRRRHQDGNRKLDDPVQRAMQRCRELTYNCVVILASITKVCARLTKIGEISPVGVCYSFVTDKFMIYNTIYAEKGKIGDLVGIIKMKPVRDETIILFAAKQPITIAGMAGEEVRMTVEMSCAYSDAINIRRSLNIFHSTMLMKRDKAYFQHTFYEYTIKIVVEYFHHWVNFFYYPEYYILAIRYVLKTDLSGLKLTSSPTFLQRENFLHSYRILFFRFSSHKNHTVWRACLVGSGQAPASTLLRSPG